MPVMLSWIVFLGVMQAQGEPVVKPGEPIEKKGDPMVTTVKHPQSFFDFSVNTLDGKLMNMAEYKGQVLLVVNTASKCGYTPQYEGLQKLYEQYKTRGFLVLGFPSNDFGGQEPGSSEDIAKFCKINYGVTFPLFEKNPVKGPEKQPVYKFLTEAPQYTGEVKWNFEKFLINKSGQVVGRYSSKVKPDSDELRKKIEENLK